MAFLLDEAAGDAVHDLRHGLERPAEAGLFASLHAHRRRGRAAHHQARAHAEKKLLVVHRPVPPDKDFMVILISDRKVGQDFRDRTAQAALSCRCAAIHLVVSGEAKPAEHNGDIWSRASTKHDAILAGKIPRFLLNISISICRMRIEAERQFVV